VVVNCFVPLPSMASTGLGRREVRDCDEEEKTPLMPLGTCYGCINLR